MTAIDYFSKIKNKYPILRFWEAPSFEPTTTWTILIDRGSNEHKNPMLRRVIGSKFAALISQNIFRGLEEDTSLEKPIQVEDYYLKPDEFATLNLFQSFTIQIVTTDLLIGRDGTVYGVQSWSSFTPLTLEWWEEGPDEWREIIDWAISTRTYLSHLLDKI